MKLPDVSQALKSGKMQNVWKLKIFSKFTEHKFLDSVTILNPNIAPNILRVIVT